MYFFLVAYSILGAGIKYIDAAFDDKIFNKTIAMILAPLLGILWAYTMLIDSVSATILLAVVVGVLITGKIDNYAHLIGMLIIFAILFLLRIEFLIIPVIFLSASAILDEVGNDYIDGEKENLNKEKLRDKFLIYFFGHRWVMKIAIIYLVLLGVVPLFFFIAMTLFDYSYVLIGSYTKLKQGIMNTTLTQRAIAKIGCIFK
ncbi:hypothetical protein AYK21_02665 [Thermoplasmatales archaeon SG8-52-2]|nr:MAG: hypothetical protein AYK21_02665 [Thermoplasmatales archaeon SG8-52-2]